MRSSGVCHRAVLYVVTNVSENPAASIFYDNDGGSRSSTAPVTTHQTSRHNTSADNIIFRRCDNLKAYRSCNIIHLFQTSLQSIGVVFRTIDDFTLPFLRFIYLLSLPNTVWVLSECFVQTWKHEMFPNILSVLGTVLDRMILPLPGI